MNDGGARNARSAVIMFECLRTHALVISLRKSVARGVVLDYLTASIAQKAAYYKFFTPAKRLIT